MENHDLVPSFSHHIESQAQSRVSECDGRPTFQVESGTVDRMVTTSTGVQTDLPRWFTPHVDLFATNVNHKLPLYVSPISDPKAWDIDALNINWTGLTAYGYPPTALLHRVIQKNQAMQLSDHTNSPRQAIDALVLGPSAALNRDPTAAPGVDNTPQAVPQLRVPQQPAARQPLMVTGLPLLTPWAHRANILLIMRTFIGCSPVSTGIAPKIPEISPSGTFLLFSMSPQKHPLSL